MTEKVEDSKKKLDPLKNLRWVPNEPSSSETLVGPPDPISNIRPIMEPRPDQETQTERSYRIKRESLQRWNHQFWIGHNRAFNKEKEDFIAEYMKRHNISKREELDSEAMSTFYRDFLNSRREILWNYNCEWYKKQFSLVWPALRVSVIRLSRRLLRK